MEEMTHRRISDGSVVSKYRVKVCSLVWKWKLLLILAYTTTEPLLVNNRLNEVNTKFVYTAFSNQHQQHQYQSEGRTTGSEIFRY